MELIIGVLAGGLISYIVSFYFFKKSKKETELDNINQLKKIKNENENNLLVIKNEFESLNEKVSNINIDKLPEKQKNEIVSIRSELVKWIDNVYDDLGRVESKINKKVAIKKEKEQKKSDLYRTYVVFLINLVDEVVGSLNRNLNNCSWNKPKLPGNLLEADINELIYFNDIKTLSLVMQKNIVSDFICRIELIDDKANILDSTYIIFKFDTYESLVKIKCHCYGKFDFLEIEEEIIESNYKRIFEKILKEVFEFVLIDIK
ncbi:hypothetical protein [Halarcobacter bivalviorum]|uniref:hypothetical protein n=1 Tax=Halarcobacter bivalviorum TaxID=663364 RepID=UPI00100BA3E6|nr:hypothetical protein [Halarcobacter bivalviorum]RXK07275.1 hypothetical protein CRU97_03975 [Halarcobacter bivalviorum]